MSERTLGKLYIDGNAFLLQWQCSAVGASIVNGTSILSCVNDIAVAIKKHDFLVSAIDVICAKVWALADHYDSSTWKTEYCGIRIISCVLDKLSSWHESFSYVNTFKERSCT